MLAQIVVRAIRASALLGAVLAGSQFTTSRGNFTGLNSRYAFLTNNANYGGQPLSYLQGQSCPFPDEWTFATIPDSIADDEQVD